MHADQRGRKSALIIAGLAALALVSTVAFMTLGARGNWSFVLGFRGVKLAALLLVAYAIAVSTVLFQTIVGNRILTPSIMGFDVLYILLQTFLVFALGAGGLNAIDQRVMFVLEAAVMSGFALLLFRWLFSGAARSIHLVMLVGILFGGLFRSLSAFMQRLIDPTDFVVLQDRFFASFNTANTELLGISAVIILAVSVLGWRLLPDLDVILVGRETAIALGVSHKRVVTLTLFVVTILVSVATALVGPVTFFGLLVANLAYMIMPDGRHRVVLPAAVLLAAITLVGGQTVLERVFSFGTALSIIVEFAGGIFFIFLLLRGNLR
ncbi:iron chelate uptake ABC transporter family permease subunit [Martelella lutilitoris]|uniref:Iron chelate uptake ABC transporter family permease subunit n=1 Tax=Martelella lutilitoris TaxID=2583532 RepID=A0A7T7KMQ7_9HYPH|nr:iron chelate uptake ABC transporter family permease subunit [Martelella lutilitoris]QQM32030.1 iron chelate uptake ABC transporter family permease subunit [Martelella lutilitoris]